MSELAAPVVFYPQVLVNVKVKDKAEAQADENVQSAVKAVADRLGDSGRILVRESGLNHSLGEWWKLRQKIFVVTMLMRLLL